MGFYFYTSSSLPFPSPPPPFPPLILERLVVANVLLRFARLTAEEYSFNACLVSVSPAERCLEAKSNVLRTF